MFNLIWVFNGYKNSMKFNDEISANEVAEALKVCTQEVRVVRCFNMVPVAEPAKPEKKRIAVRVQFPNYPKVYTYLAHKHVSPGDEVLVNTRDGLKRVKVKECKEMTDPELAAICDLSRFSYIQGKIDPA